MKKKLAGFTLIELLVVVAIIAVLISILLPSIQMARESARTIVCGTQVRNYGTAFAFYADDYNGMICIGDNSRGIHWAGMYAGYLHTSVQKLNWCPSLPNGPKDTDVWNGVYGIDWELWGHNGLTKNWKDKYLAFYKAEKMHPWGLLMTETMEWKYQTGNYGQFEDPRHQGGFHRTTDEQVIEFNRVGRCNYLFSDGHVETLYSPVIPPEASAARFRDTIDEVGPNF